MAQMNFEYEDYTELFELFGQELFCPICQEEGKEGERVLEVQQCKHLFHETCLDPWLRQKGTCPLCRVSIFGENHLRMIQQTHLIALLHILEQQILNERRMLTWVLCDGILQRFPRANDYQANRAACTQILQDFSLNNIRILPIEFENRTRLQRFAGQIRSQLLLTYQDRSNRIRNWADILMLRQYVSNYALMNPAFQAIWE
jgi:hypothetical protein